MKYDEKKLPQKAKAFWSDALLFGAISLVLCSELFSIFQEKNFVSVKRLRLSKKASFFV